MVRFPSPAFARSCLAGYSALFFRAVSKYGSAPFPDNAMMTLSVDFYVFGGGWLAHVQTAACDVALGFLTAFCTPRL